MLLGMWSILSQSQTAGPATRGAARTVTRGAEVVFPESRVARVIGGRGVTGGERTARVRRTAAGEAAASRERVQAGQAGIARGRMAEREARRQAAAQPQTRETVVTRTRKGNKTTYRTTRRLLNDEAGSYGGTR